MKLTTVAFSALVAGVACAQQRTIHDISPNAQIHVDPIVSPDGQFVVYQATGKLALIASAGGPEVTLATSASLGSFVWAPTSRRIYYTDGNQIKRVSTAGQGATTIATFGAQESISVWSVDSTDSILYGSRYDPAQTRYYIFELDTGGSQAPNDLVNSQNILNEARIDPTDSWLVYREQGTQPFDPVDINRVQADGQNMSTIVPQIQSLGESVYWVDDGNTVIYDGLDSGGARQIMRCAVGGAPEPLTSGAIHLTPTVRGGWIVCQAIDQLGGNGPAIMPIEGGSLTYLYHSQRYTYSGFPTIDANGGSVVFAGARFGQGENAKLWRLDLDGEMNVTPRVAIGQLITFELPALTNEIGVLFLGRRQTPSFTLPGVMYEFNLGSNFAILQIARGNSANSIKVPLPLPNDSALQFLSIDFQGLRYDPTTQMGENTRFGGFTIF